VGVSLVDALECLKLKEKAAQEISKNIHFNTLSKRNIGKYMSVRSSRVMNESGNRRDMTIDTFKNNKTGGIN
jgi:hypothetical protein